jgi:hypothetical protein
MVIAAIYGGAAGNTTPSFPRRRGFQQPKGWSSGFSLLPEEQYKQELDSRLRGNDELKN